MNNPLAPGAIDAAATAKKAADEAATALKPKKRHACMTCLRDFQYGDFVMRPVGSKEILCANCAKRDRPKDSMETVIYGGVKPGAKPSVMARERAAKNLKKMARFKKGVAREQRIADNGGKNKRR